MWESLRPWFEPLDCDPQNPVLKQLVILACDSEQKCSPLLVELLRAACSIQIRPSVLIASLALASLVLLLTLVEGAQRLLR